MDVTCERCSTEYEFDDALVSERGTTVKCTNCGHQFKVRRSDGLAAPERWLVRTVDGRELEFTALRELQAAISHSKVTREDVLSRGAARPRRLGSIAELDPFFHSTPPTSPGIGAVPAYPPAYGPGPSGAPRARMQTPAGLGAVPAGPPMRTEGSVAIPLPISPTRGYDEPPLVARRPGSIPPPAGELPRVQPPPRPASAPPPPVLPGVVVSPADAPPLPDAMVARMATLPTPGPRADGRPEGRPDVELGPTLPVPVQSPFASSHAVALPPPPRTPSAPPVAYARPPAFAGGEAPRNEPRSSERPPRSSDPPVATGRRPLPSAPPLTPTPGDARASYTNEDGSTDPRYTDPRFSSLVPSKRASAARLIVGILAAGLVVFAGVTVGKKYLSAGGGPAKANPTEPGADRVTALLQESEKSLADGDLETAKEQIDKASGIAESDPRIAAQQARLAVARADVTWLKSRLLPADDADLGAVKKELELAADRVKKAADRAAELAPAEASVVRSRIDALRIAGDRQGARKLTGGLSATSSHAESALALAALDLSEDKPDWPTAIDRLRAAASAEQSLGRARSMLVYALARSGDAGAAKTELERLAGLSRPHPLTQLLRAFVARAEKDRPVDVSSLPDAPAKGAPKDKEPKERPRSGGARASAPDDGRVPDDYVHPDYATTGGAAAPPATGDPPAATAAPAPAPAPTPEPPPQAPPSPPAIDTSDLPGFKPGGGS